MVVRFAGAGGVLLVFYLAVCVVGVFGGFCADTGCPFWFLHLLTVRI